MEHFYQNIHGWFDFEDIYSEIVNSSNDNSHFIEVGSWMGKSTSYMGVEIINSGKNIKFDCIDIWDYSPILEDFNSYDSYLKLNNITNPYLIFLQNINAIINYVNPIKISSVDASKLYSDESLDFVFIDAGHDYDNIKQDIECWYPKVKKGGVIAGHDYVNSNDIRISVKNFFNNNYEIRKSSWYHKKIK